MLAEEWAQWWRQQRLLTYKLLYIRDQGGELAGPQPWPSSLQARSFEGGLMGGVQIHGGYGYSKDLSHRALFPDSRVTEIYGGDNEINKL